MKFLSLVAPSFVLIAGLSACGGGGGGSTSGSPSVGNISSVQEVSSSSLSSSSSSSSYSSVPANVQTKVDFIFPLKDTLVTGDKITVRGHASDGNGIAQVTVNGIPATLSTASSIGLSSSASLLKTISRKLSFGVEDQSDTVLPATDVNWQATIDVPFGTTKIDVVVQDGLGNSEADQTNSVNLKNLRVPNFLFMDSANNRWIGLGGFYLDSLAIDMTTRTTTLLPELTYAYKNYGLDTQGGLAVRGADNSIYAGVIFSDKLSTLQIHRVEISTAINHKLVDFDIGLDTSKYLFASVQSGAMDPLNDVYYLLVNSFPISQPPLVSSIRSQIFSYEISSGKVNVVYDSESDTSLVPNFRNMTFAGGDLYLLKNADSFYQEGVYKFSLTDGFVKHICDLASYGNIAISVNKSLSFSYVVGLQSIAKVNLQDSSVSYLSQESDQEDIHFPQPVSLVVDDEHDQLIVGDTIMSDLFTVDISTGKRSLFVETGMGAGPKLNQPSQISLTNDKSTAYVLDNAPNAKPIIFKIDLASGDRTKLLVLDSPSFGFSRFQALILDEPNHRLFAAYGTALIVLDTLTDAHIILNNLETKEGVALGEIAGMAYDAQSNKLIISNWGTSNLFEFNLELNQLEIFKNLTGSQGAELSDLASLVQISDGSFYGMSGKTGKLYRINLTSGEATEVLSACIDRFGRNVLSPEFDTLMNLEFDDHRQEFVIYGFDYQSFFDLKSNQCNVTNFYLNQLDGKNFSDSTVVETYMHEIVLKDRVTNEMVVLSR